MPFSNTLLTLLRALLALFWILLSPWRFKLIQNTKLWLLPVNKREFRFTVTGEDLLFNLFDFGTNKNQRKVKNLSRWLRWANICHTSLSLNQFKHWTCYLTTYPAFLLAWSIVLIVLIIHMNIWPPELPNLFVTSTFVYETSEKTSWKETSSWDVNYLRFR